MSDTRGLPRKGEVLTARLTELDDDGLALTRIEWPLPGEMRRMKFIARGALPGDLALVRVEGRNRDTLIGRMAEIIEPAEGRIEPNCRHARYQLEGNYCGGCTLQHLAYGGQLALKRRRVEKAFEVAGIKVPLGETVAAPSIFGHRHKMELSFASDRLGPEIGTVQLGLHPPGLKWEVISLEECPLTSAKMSRLIPRLGEVFAATGAHAWDPRDTHGFLRNLVVREGKRTSDVLIEILTTPADPVVTRHGPIPARALLDDLKIKILAEAALLGLEISALLWTVHEAERGKPTRYHTVALHGATGMTEVLRVPGPDGDVDLCFDISPRAFFQPHPLAAEGLIRQVHRRLPQGCRVVLDLYCGTGTLALTIAPSAERVVGIELVPEAIAGARNNAERNGLVGCRFIAGDVEVELARLKSEEPALLSEVDAVLLDPPRSGLTPKAMEHLLSVRPPRIIYVSCKPESLGRDLRKLLEAGYKVDGEATPVDLFPHSHHVETVVALVAGEVSS
jgi:23S rRNA (uracil1939-C5)-methyltransferase